MMVRSVLVAAVVSGAPLTFAAPPPEPAPAPTERSADELYQAGRELHNTKPDEALKLYEQAAAKGHVSSHKQIGALKMRAGDNAAAVAAYRKYLELAPDAADADIVRDVVKRLGATR